MLTGSIIIDIEGKEITQRDIQRLSHPVVCGVILFTRNFDNKNQIQDLISSIKSVRDDLLITVDHEGGRVQRFRENFYAMPSMSKLGDLYAHDSEQGLRLARYAGWLIARELGELHIDLNYSPVLDVNYGKSSVIGNRSFSDNPKAIIELAKAFVDGQHQAGMTSVGKHFPGHGFIHEDSHQEISLDNRSLTEMENDIDCFESLINYGLGAVMPGHVIYKKADNNPASLSSFWLKDYLRKRLNFKGIIISDDLSMKGVADYIPDISERVSQALTAGCDVALICNEPEDVDKFLDRTGYDDFAAPDLSQLRIKNNQNSSIDGFHVEDVKNLMKNMNFIHIP